MKGPQVLLAGLAPKLACGADGTLLPSVTCNYCNDTGHFKDNCVWLNNKIA